MKRIRPAGILLLVAFAVSLAVMGRGICRLVRVQTNLDDGAKRLKRQFEEAAAGGDGTLAGGGFPLDGYTALGVLTFCGDAQTAAPVYLGTSDGVLEKGIGLAEDTAALNHAGNAVLFGHRDSAFRELQHLKEGDCLSLETAEGKREYLVTSIYITDPEDPHIYDTVDSTRLTLVTCYPFSFVGPAPERCVVVAESREA